MTMAELTKKRKCFWDTRVEGKTEIWQVKYLVAQWAVCCLYFRLFGSSFFSSVALLKLSLLPLP